MSEQTPQSINNRFSRILIILIGLQLPLLIMAWVENFGTLSIGGGNQAEVVFAIFFGPLAFLSLLIFPFLIIYSLYYFMGHFTTLDKYNKISFLLYWIQLAVYTLMIYKIVEVFYQMQEYYRELSQINT